MRLEWTKLLSTKRVSEFGPCSSSNNSNSNYYDPRSPYEKDFDQIIFSYPFRRLQDKTQVIPFPKYDFVHTRLTHTLEVASIGRSLGKMAASLIFGELSSDYISNMRICPSDIGALVAAACLAHDLGNPPFGHSGESAISYYFLHMDIEEIFRPLTMEVCDGINNDGTCLFNFDDNTTAILGYREVISNTKKWNDLCNFEGNANGFRILTLNCEKGINPTAALLGVFSKYPRECWLEDDPYANLSKKEKPASQQKYGFFYEQRELFEEVAITLGLHKVNNVNELDIAYHRHPLAFLMEAADDIAYRMIDFEDGIRLGLIDFTKKYKLYKSRAGKEGLNEDFLVEISPLEILVNIAKTDSGYNPLKIENRSEKDQIGYLRGMVINTLIHESFKVFRDNYEAIMHSQFDSSIVENIKVTDIQVNLFMMRTLIENHVYSYIPVLENEAAGFEVLGILINDFAITTNICISCRQEETAKQKKIKSLIPVEFQPSDEDRNGIVDFDQQYKRILKILDYVSGMTDSFAINKYKKIHGIEIS